MIMMYNRQGTCGLAFIALLTFCRTFAAAATATEGTSLDFSGFEPFSGSPQDFNRIDVGLSCRDEDTTDSRGQIIPKIKWTIEPVDDEEEVVVISSKPPSLVDAILDEGVLHFQFNNVSYASHPGGAGVRIQVPSRQLKQVATVGKASLTAQVLPGFANLNDVLVESNGAALLAQMDNGNDPDGVNKINLVSTGESNLVQVGGSNVLGGAIVNVTLDGRFNSVFVMGTIVDGLISGTNEVLYINETIEQLTVTGKNNLITAKTGCNNVVEDVPGSTVGNNGCSDRGATDTNTVVFPDEFDSAISTTQFTFTCGSGSSSAAGHQCTQTGTTAWPFALVMLLWLTVF